MSGIISMKRDNGVTGCSEKKEDVTKNDDANDAKSESSDSDDSDSDDSDSDDSDSNDNDMSWREREEALPKSCKDFVDENTAFCGYYTRNQYIVMMEKSLKGEGKFVLKEGRWVRKPILHLE